MITTRIRRAFSANFLISLCITKSLGQTNFAKDPKDAVFIKSDVDNFWKAFDMIEKELNPFVNYLETGTIGLKDFIPYRIESANKLLKTVKKRKQDYEDVRKKSESLADF